MEHCRKIRPEVKQQGAGLRFDKEDRRVRLILKLANIRGYNDLHHIKSHDGQYMVDTDVRNLIKNALAPSKNSNGEDRFIKLMHEAGVEPELIINKRMRDALNLLYTQHGNAPVVHTPISLGSSRGPEIEKELVGEPTVYINEPEYQTIPQPQLSRRVLKRKNDDEYEEPSKRHRSMISDWHVPQTDPW